MVDYINALLVIVLALNLFALGTSRIQSVIRIVAAQGAILGVVTLLAHERLALPVVLSAAAAIGIKGIVIPAVISRSLRSADIKREVEPFIGFIPSIIIGAVATAATLLVSSRLSAPAATGANIAGAANIAANTLIIPASITTIFVGFLILVSRFKAVTQVLGYLVLENGIYLFGTLLVEAIPLVVEMGMLLDLFVGVFVISIITNHINRAFSSMDTRRLVSLKE
jgi:hydrogenase-4 component E